MIQMQSFLAVADNSGAKTVFCIKVLGGSKKKYASLGDIIVVSVREALPASKVKKEMCIGRLSSVHGRKYVGMMVLISSSIITPLS